MLKSSFIYAFLFFLIILILFFSLFGQNSDEELHIGIIGDQTGTHNLDFSYKILENAVGKLNQRSPDIVLHVGDMVESIKGVHDFEGYEKYFDRAINIMNHLECPWFLTAGDHDVDPPGFKPGSLDRSRETWFKTLCNKVDLPLKESLYYSFDFRGYHFISLYSLENLHTDPRWGPILLNKVPAKQLNWLKDDLENHKNSKGILVFLHHPHWYVWSNWSEVHQILKKYPVAAVIAGHYHYDQDGGILDGIRYLVIGSTGGVVKKSDSHSGGSYQFATLTLFKNKISDITLYDVETDSVLELTPRKSMDRLQALSCMMDKLYMDENIYVQNGSLYKRSDSGGYIKLTKIGLESIANPIDLPIHVEITSMSTGLYNPCWNKNSQYLPATHSIELSPGERVGWSNYSSVGQWFKSDALWLCDIIEDSTLWSQSSSIDLTIKASFKDERERWIISNTSFRLKKIE